MSVLATLTGTCPCCNGTKKTQMGDCRNCGGQYMFGTPSGTVRLRPDGSPCRHSYREAGGSRCYTKYACTHCGDSYGIDSGD